MGFEVDYNAPGEYASLHHKTLGRLAVHVTDHSDHSKGALPYFLCDDIKASIADFREKGITTTEPTREGESPWFTDFIDNVGNRWGIEEI